MKSYFYNDDLFNFDYGQAKAASGNFKEAEEVSALHCTHLYTFTHMYTLYSVQNVYNYSQLFQLLFINFYNLHSLID